MPNFIDDAKLAGIKDFFSHELKRNREERKWNQSQAADFLGISERTYQRLEDSKVFDCAFSKATKSFSGWAAFSNYSLKNWFIKTCCPDDQDEVRTKFKWETEIIKLFHMINPAIRRAFSKNIESQQIEKAELVILISNYLFNMKIEDLNAVFGFFAMIDKKDSIPKKAIKNYLDASLELLK